MDREKFKNQWHHLRDEVKEKWTELTDEDLLYISGEKNKLIEKLQERYSLSRESAEREIHRKM